VYRIEVLIDKGIDATISDGLLQAAARAALINQNAPEGDLTILVTSDERMADLNQAHRGVAATTDVLSFPADDPLRVPGQPPYFGDIAISLRQAREQAAERGHALDAELQLLVVHGALHLLGYHHANREDKLSMWAVQEGILTALGVSVSVES
jgi:probable rRNA maturation factor